MMNGERRHEYPRLIERLARLEEKLISAERALTLATSALDKRLDSMNEIREQLTAQANTFLLRDTFDYKHAILQKQVDYLRLAEAKIQGKASMTSVYITYIFSGIAIILSLIHIFR